MKDNFEKSLTGVLVFEGGYVNDPQDPGGETNKGVTKRVYDAYRRNKSQKTQSVKLITQDEIEDIYRKQYWAQVGGDKMPDGVDLVLFDGSVHSGPSQSVKWLQKSLRDMAGYAGQIDGKLGQMSYDALAAVGDYDLLIAKICEYRMKFLKALKTFKRFGSGWTSRVSQLKKKGQAWATGSVGESLQYARGGERRGLLEDHIRPPTKAVGDAAVGGGSISATIIQAQDQLSVFTDIGYVQQIVVWLTIASLAVAAGGFVYRYYAKKRGDALKEALDVQ